MMQLRRLVPCVAALVFLALAGPSWATSIIQPSFESLVSAADYVVRVKVKSVDSSWQENPARPGERYIGSQVSLDILETITGTPPRPLVLDVVGGQVGETKFVVDGTPELKTGDECILFVRGNGRAFFPVVALVYGYFPVQRDAKTGTAQVLRYDRRPLYGTDELAPGATTRAARSALERPLTPAAFRERIRQQHRDTLSRDRLR